MIKSLNFLKTKNFGLYSITMKSFTGKNNINSKIKNWLKKKNLFKDKKVLIMKISLI
jgi:hypothetical protein